MQVYAYMSDCMKSFPRYASPHSCVYVCVRAFAFRLTLYNASPLSKRNSPFDQSVQPIIYSYNPYSDLFDSLFGAFFIFICSNLIFIRSFLVILHESCNGRCRQMFDQYFSCFTHTNLTWLLGKPSLVQLAQYRLLTSVFDMLNMLGETMVRHRSSCNACPEESRASARRERS